MTFGYTGRFDPAAKVFWKTEGLTDAIAIMSLNPTEGHLAACNACGATEKPDPGWCGMMADIGEVFVIHDCDVPGQTGATWVTNPATGRKRPGWAPAIAAYNPRTRNVILPYPIEPNHGKDVRDWIVERLNAGIDRASIYAELLEYARSMPLVEPPDGLPISGQDDGDSEDDAEDDTELDDSDDGTVVEVDGDGSQGKGDDPAEPIWEGEDDPHRLARVNLDRYRDEHGGHLVFWCSEWWKYRRGCYQTIEKDSLKAKVNAAIRREFEDRWREEEERRIAKELATGEEQKREPIRKVKSGLVNDVIEAMKSLAIKSDSIEMPCWLPDKSVPRLVSLRNGLLDLDALFAGQSDCLRPHTPEWFSRVQLPYEFDPAAICPHWQAFLEDVFNGDRESIVALQMWFGYLLTQDTSLQKMMMIIGKPRCGKGTISRTLNAMLGRESVCTPTLGNLAVPTELHGLIGKSVALINETRLSDRADKDVITERLLSIVGEDAQDVQRKYLTTMHSVRLALRFTMFSNVIPSLNDSSSAIVKRCLVLVMPNTYYEREDRGLTDRLKTELPGILLWSIAGRQMLNEAKEIKQPESGREIIKLFKSLSSPVSVFIESECVEGDTCEVETRELYEHWCRWCLDNDYDQKFTIQQFSKRLRDAIPELKIIRPGTGYDRSRKFKGISIVRENIGEEF